jgi:hypothetical protein
MMMMVVVVVVKIKISSHFKVVAWNTKNGSPWV